MMDQHANFACGRRRRVGFCAGRHHRQGAVFVTALGIILILTGLVLVFNSRMKVDYAAASNRASYIQADAVEKGAEAWVRALVESYPGDAVTINQLSNQGMPIGNGCFWILHPDPTQDQTYGFGITDEAGKLNINTASSAQIMMLPNMTDQDIADSIYAWSHSETDPDIGNGAESDYYESLPDPYACKNSPYETVEELQLVKGVSDFTVTPNFDLLYGSDANHDGVIDNAEQQQTGTGSTFGAMNGTTTDSRGIFNYVTCYSAAPTVTPTGTAPVNVATINSTKINNLQTALQNASNIQDASQIISVLGKIQNTAGRPFTSRGAFWTAAKAVGLTAQQFGEIYDYITIASASPVPAPTPIPINVSTAPLQALQCLQLQQGEAEQFITARGQNSAQNNMGLFFQTISPTEISTIANSGMVTGTSFQYSADIVAFGQIPQPGDHHSVFKRVRIVVDASLVGSGGPARIIYRKDLSSLAEPDVMALRQADTGELGLNQGLGGGSLNNLTH